MAKLIHVFLLLRFLSFFYGDFLEIIGLKAPGNYSASIWSNIFSICLWESPKLFISMISAFLDVSRPPKTNYFYLWRHQDTQRKSKKSLEHFKDMIFVNLNISEIHIFDNFRKDGHRKMMKIRLIKSWNSWIRHQYLSNMKWKFDNSYICFSFSSKGIPSTPQHTDSHPCTRPGSSRSLSEWSRSLTSKALIDAARLLLRAAVWQCIPDVNLAAEACKSAGGWPTPGAVKEPRVLACRKTTRGLIDSLFQARTLKLK